MDKFREYIHNLHDVEVNQRYNGLPYSVHLKFVEAQCNRFLYLVDEEDRLAVLFAAISHDTIEDARLTHNNFCV